MAKVFPKSRRLSRRRRRRRRSRRKRTRTRTMLSEDTELAQHAGLELARLVREHVPGTPGEKDSRPSMRQSLADGRLSVRGVLWQKEKDKKLLLFCEAKATEKETEKEKEKENPWETAEWYRRQAWVRKSRAAW
jgi:hypothetical protein